MKMFVPLWFQKMCFRRKQSNFGRFCWLGREFVGWKRFLSVGENLSDEKRWNFFPIFFPLRFKKKQNSSEAERFCFLVLGLGAPYRGCGALKGQPKRAKTANSILPATRRHRGVAGPSVPIPNRDADAAFLRYYTYMFGCRPKLAKICQILPKWAQPGQNWPTLAQMAAQELWGQWGLIGTAAHPRNM